MAQEQNDSKKNKVGRVMKKTCFADCCLFAARNAVPGI